MEILVTIKDFLKNGGKLIIDRPLYKKDGKLLGYYIGEKSNNKNELYYYNSRIDQAIIDVSLIMVKIKVKPIYE